MLRNIPIPPAIQQDAIQIIKDRIASGVYEPLTAAYRSCWFCVVKQDGKSLRLVHDLQPLNAVTIRDASTPPFVEQLAESFAGYAVYGMMDLFAGYDQRPLHVESRDMTTFSSPMGPQRLTTLPMGYTNAVQIYQADMSFILQDEIPHYTMPFIDDLPVKSRTTRYQSEDGSFETIPENSGIRRFIWEHLIVINRILQRLQNVGAMVSTKKFVLAALDAVIVGHKCTFEGRIPHESKVQKIQDWPECSTVTHVRGFLGTCGVLRIFIRNYAAIARPLVDLTRKGVPFEWGESQRNSMQRLKDEILKSPALKRIDYESGREVILAVDTSVIAVGYILFQEGEDGKHYPNRFGSISLTEVESRYSQAKLELYGLFRALRAVRIFIFGVANLTVEMDAKYVKGMINNPDLQPNATINRWIAGILLFHFKLVHISADKHSRPDGLSRRPQAEEDPPDEDHIEDWLDDAYFFAIELLNERPYPELYAHRLEECYSHVFLPVYHSRNASPANFYILARDPDHISVHSLSLDSADPTDEAPEIPRSPKAKSHEERIQLIRLFLETQERPDGMSDKDYQSFLNSATRFFILSGSLWRREPHGKHQLVIPESRWYGLIKEAHDDLGHKGVFTVRTRLLLRFWWPMLVEDVKWYLRTCHSCQIRQTRKLRIPPHVPLIGGLFAKVHIDTMLMPRASGYRYIIQARCALTSYPEWRMLRAENASAISSFIFEDILCRWGAVSEIVTDNGPSFVQALDLLAKKHGIQHIRISPYNSQANGIVERRHYDVREAIMKSCDGEEAQWPHSAHSVFWAERVTILKSTSLSPYFMAHGIEPLFPFDLSEATFLVPVSVTDPLSTSGLIAWHARQLQKCEEDLESMKERIFKARFDSIKQFEATFKN